MKKVLTVLVAAGFLLAPTAAHASGSDSPTPYEVTVEGVTLPAGQVFQDGGHINVRTNQGNANLHFEDRNWPVDHRKRAYIGKSFVPWEAFGFDPATLCVSWVQIHGFNEHFGEGGQEPVGLGCLPDVIEYADASSVNCEDWIVTITKSKRVSTHVKNKEGEYVLVPGDWVVIEETTREATVEDCPAPEPEYWTGETHITDCEAGVTTFTYERYRYDYILVDGRWTLGEPTLIGTNSLEVEALVTDCEDELPATGGTIHLSWLSVVLLILGAGTLAAVRHSDRKRVDTAR